MIRTKDDVARCYHESHRDVAVPHVNVKVRRGLEDVKFEGDREIPDGLTVEWIRANISEDELNELFWQTCQNEWEMLQQDAEEIFGSGVEVNAGGRSGGWACVTGLEDIESWDAVMLAKWKKFARYAGEYAKGIPEQMVYSIEANEWQAAQEEAVEEAGVHLDAAQLIERAGFEQEQRQRRRLYREGAKPGVLS